MDKIGANAMAVVARELRHRQSSLSFCFIFLEKGIIHDSSASSMVPMVWDATSK